MKLDADNKARIAFAALLVLLAVGAAVWYLLWAGRFTTYQIRTHDPVSGLIPEAPVEFHGVEVGKIEQVDLVDARTIRVLLSVRSDAPVTAATVATITARGVATRGFTGYVYVALENAGADSGRLVAQPGERYPTIPTAPSKIVSLDLMIAQVNDNVQTLTALVRDVLDPQTVASLKETLAGLRQVTKTLADNNERLDTLIANAEAASRRLQPLLLASQRTVDALEPLVRSSQQTVDALQPLLKSSQQTVYALQPLVKSSQDTVDALQTQVLPQAYKALVELNRLTAALDGFATKVSKDPSVVVRGPPRRPLGPGERE
jgi:phospholipid/cholesterol/gamma-HCH transport system substrate-binding protein